MAVIRVGDLVRWRGTWGSEPAQHARVTGIELCAGPRQKNGRPVVSVVDAEKDRACFDLMTAQGARWAYGEQVTAIGEDDPGVSTELARLLSRVKMAREPKPARRYTYKPARPDPEGDAIIDRACEILAARMRRPGEVINKPETARRFVQLRLGGNTRECFSVLFLDAQHRIIDWREMFHGTLTQTSVYPREVVREALALNAAAVLLAHNHPSGVAEPSRADQVLTKELQLALKMVDVAVLDHIIACGNSCQSFAEMGLL
jgi:DNA repair protein RadC